MKTMFNRLLKTTVLAAFMLAAFSMSAFAKPTDVSKYLVKQFQKQFQHATNVTWKTTDRFTSATFTLNGDNVAVFYNNQNDMIGMSKDITVENLPKAAQKIINTQYSNQKVVSVIDFTDAGGNENYYIQLDANGKETILQADDGGRISEFQKS